MDIPFDFKDEGARTVYVKAVDVADLPDDVKAEAGEREQIYAVHDSDGQQIALVTDRRTAFFLARENDYSPVAVH